ncbi:MAG: hypothetical protein ACI9BW_000633 [Gammaproteobacteria bacterium]
MCNFCTLFPRHRHIRAIAVARAPETLQLKTIPNITTRFGVIAINKNIPIPFLLLLIGATLGFSGILLFSGVQLGLNVALFCLLIITSVIGLRAHRKVRLENAEYGLFGIFWLLAFGFAWRDSSTLHWLSLSGGVLVFMLLYQKSFGRSIAQCGPYEMFVEIFRSIITLGRSAPILVRNDIPWKDFRSQDANRFCAIGRGLLGALPILMLFGTLLIRSDQRFEFFAGRFFNWDAASLFEQMVIFSICSFLAIGFLKTCADQQTEQHCGVTHPNWAVGGIEVSIVLASLNAFFFAYIIIQISYFFGDDSLVKQSGALSYARRGFFELVFLSCLLIPLLLVSRWLLRNTSTASVRIHRVLALGLVAMVLVIVASAMHRMQLYTQAYGLTELRFYTSAFMVRLSVIYFWFCRTILFGAPNRFWASVCC